MAGTGLTGFLQNLTGGEMVIIALVVLVVLGPERLPEMARGAGKMLHKVRTMTEGMQSEVRDVMADPSMQPLKELGELAARPRQKLTEYALEAEAEERAKREAKEAAAAEAAVAEAEAAEADADDDADGPDDGRRDADRCRARQPWATQRARSRHRRRGDPGDPGDHPGTRLNVKRPSLFKGAEREGADMTLADHLRELRYRLLLCVGSVASADDPGVVPLPVVHRHPQRAVLLGVDQSQSRGQLRLPGHQHPRSVQPATEGRRLRRPVPRACPSCCGSSGGSSHPGSTAGSGAMRSPSSGPRWCCSCWAPAWPT